MKQTIKLWIILAVLTATFLPAGAGGFTWQGGGDETAFFDNASAKIEQQLSHGKLPALNRIYKELFYAPLWVKAGGLSPFGNALLKMIRTDATVTRSLPLYAENRTVRQHVKDLVAQQGGSLADKIALELAMSKLYLHYARYRLYGGISWQPFARKLEDLTKAYKIKVGWKTYRPKTTPASILNTALNDGDLAHAFADADPKRFGYAHLRKRLVDYIHLAQKGGWPTLPRFGTIKPGGSQAKVIPLIRKHLAMVGDLQGCSEPEDSPKYDPCLVKAVKRFQIRHGLKGGGVIGRKTRAALNMTVTQAIQKIRLNLDRIKWLYRKQAKMRIELNIPSFRLNFLDGDKLVTTIRVITGKPNHPTPSFHNTMTYIVVNPYWKIPEGIVKSEMIPKLMQDPYHYEAQGKELHESWDENSPRVDPGTVNWAQYRAKNKHIPYYFMQVPGRHNALGKIKFLFPNGYSVYIHDTPSKSLFFRDVRAFSHGCMRIQKPRELLESLALFNDNIHVDEIMKLLEGTEKKTISLKHKVPIDITYLTAFIDPYGYLNFRKDIYHYDQYQMKNYTPKCVNLVEKQAHKSTMPAAKKPSKKPSTTVTKKSVQANKAPTKKQTKKSPNDQAAKPMAPAQNLKKKTKRLVASPGKKANNKIPLNNPKANKALPPSQKAMPVPPPEKKAPTTKASSPSASDMIQNTHRAHKRIDADGYQIMEVY